MVASEWSTVLIGYAAQLTWLFLLIEWLLRLLALFVVPRNRRPTAGLTWLTLIFLVPIPGWILYLILGSFKLPHRRRMVQKNLDSVLERLSANVAVKNKATPADHQSLITLSQSLSHMPLTSATACDVLTDYHQIIKKIADDISSAQTIVHLEYYTFVVDKETEPLFAAIEQARARGVQVRVLYDAFGTRRYLRPSAAMRRRLLAAGVQVQSSLPLKLIGHGYTRPDLRNHRKLVTIDGRVGYTGSQNIIARHYHRRDSIVYDELVVRLEGPIVAQLDAVFAADWFAETSKDVTGDIPTPSTVGSPQLSLQLLPSGPGFDDENNLKIFTAAMYDAARTITIVNPYFVPEESLLTAIESAAKRGVKVTLVNSSVMDQWMVGHAQRSYYEQLLQAGVDIYWYNSPVLLHSKFLVIDDTLALVGSSNMDIRSFELDHELTLLIYSQHYAQQLQKVADNYISASKKVNKKTWLSRRRYKQLLDNIARLTSSLQ